MSAYYQTILSLNFAVLALLVGGLASIYQIATEAGPAPVAGMIRRARGLRALLAILTLNLGLAMAGAVLLSTPHDIIEAYDLRADAILGGPLTGFLVGGTSILAGITAALVIAQVASALSPVGATKALLASLDSHDGSRESTAAILSGVADYARRTLRDGRVREFGAILRLLAIAVRDSQLLRQDAQVEVVEEIAEHLVPLVEDAILADRFDQAAAVVSCATALASEVTNRESLRSILRLQQLTADELLKARASRALCAVIDDIARVGIAAVGLEDGKSVFDDSCVTLGGIGERVPATFLHPTEPEVNLRPPEYRDPLGALDEAFERLRSAAYPTDNALPIVDLLIWRDALLRASEALVARINNDFRDARLETRLVTLAGQLKDVSRQAAERDDWRTVYYVITALNRLAEQAEQPFYQEYPQDVAGWLIAAGMQAEEDDAEIALVGESLAELAANGVSRSLADRCAERCQYLLNAGELGDLPWQARWKFIKRLGVKLHTNFELAFDPTTGADLRP